MNIKKWLTLSLICGMAISWSSGCLRRKESITVFPDGTIRLSLDFEGDRKDLEEGDAMPSEVRGWQVTRTVEQRDNEKDSHLLHASQMVAPDGQLPDTFALPGDPDSDLYLRFPTTYTKDVREDGVYHVFRRIYPERSWARLQYWEEFLIKDHHRELAEKPLEELSDGERRTLLEAFAAVEAYKQAELADQALTECHASLPAWCGLQARQALLDTYEAADIDAIGDRCIAVADPERQASCFDRETDRLHRTATDAYKSVLAQAASLDHRELVAFDRSMERARKRQELTGQLASQQFEITVQMPGKLVAHNGFRVEESDSHVTADWEFDGRAFRDRSLELILITRESINEDPKDRDLSDDR